MQQAPWFGLGGPPAPRLPSHDWRSSTRQTGASALLHATLAVMLVTTLRQGVILPKVVSPVFPPTMVNTTHIVFLASEAPVLQEGGGGGGGGNRQKEPVRKAEGKGSDDLTVRVAKRETPVPSSLDPPATDAPRVPEVVADVKAMASGYADQLGLPESGVNFGTSLGPGSGGGEGSGEGTGLGPGTGAGIGPGSGGGTGGGVYRPGGNVTRPQVVTEVRPSYTNDALRAKIQGTVVVEVVVTPQGRPSAIRVVRSLDPGLDEEARKAVAQWVFEPGRLAGTPVHVLVTVMLDFAIR